MLQLPYAHLQPLLYRSWQMASRGLFPSPSVKWCLWGGSVARQLLQQDPLETVWWKCLPFEAGTQQTQTKMEGKYRLQRQIRGFTSAYMFRHTGGEKYHAVRTQLDWAMEGTNTILSIQHTQKLLCLALCEWVLNNKVHPGANVGRLIWH